ncbi:MAG TPA: ATP-binding protein [Polyangia bacterium]|jgi:PAS domain S-box-containing protein|nr:ATP-binding protein [Polyangia bacterium]
MSDGTPVDPSVVTDPAARPPPTGGRPAIEVAGRVELVSQLALEAGEIGTWEWNIGSGEVRWSDNLEQIHGLEPGTFDRTFEGYKMLIHPEDREMVLGAIRGCLEGRVAYEVEFRSADISRGVRWILGKGKVIPGEGGGAARMIGVCMDVTSRKRAEETAWESNRRKDEFLAMVSHELRNPLAVISNASTLIGQLTKNDPETAKASGSIRRQTERLARIVDDLMEVSRLSAGKLTLRRTSVDLVGLVHRAVQDFVERHLLDRHRYELRFAATRVSGDGPRLEQIVSNLLMNAVKYTPLGGTIAIEVEPDRGEAVLRVRDTGVGIAPELLPRVFDLFVQSERGVERRDGGLGVGLSIARGLVEAHGGRIEARSPGPDLGTEFVVRLPLAATFAAGDQSDGAPRRRILIVDDNVDAREALARLLEMAGHEVAQAGDGPGGLEAASRARPDVAIVDIGLPGMNGFDLGRRLRAATPHVRLIALTGYSHDDHRRQGDDVGFETYLVKPVTFETLQRALANN